MGVILDSSVVIAAERRGDTVVQLIEQIVNRIGDQEAALSGVVGQYDFHRANQRPLGVESGIAFD